MGKSTNIISDTKKAKSIGLEILVFTSNNDSELAKLVAKIIIVSRTVKGDTGAERKSIQLLSSVFDQSIHIVLDGLCLYLSQRDSISNDAVNKTYW